MSTPSKELIGIPHVAFLHDEAALKELVTIFNRMGFPGISFSLRPETAHLVTPEFGKHRSMLFDLGILYEPVIGKTPDSDTRNADYSESLIRFQKSPGASPLFWVEPRRLALLEAESTLPGSIVAFVTQAKSMFSS